jgi:hypothetical protein
MASSNARHHAEWLSLIEVSGPFLSLPVLLRVFPQGLDAHDPDHFRDLRVAYEEWEESGSRRRSGTADHRAWIRFVLEQTLELPDEVIAEGQAIPQTLKAVIAEHGETLRPDIVILNPEGGTNPGKPRLLIQLYPRGQDLEKEVAGLHWKASPATRMMELLHSTDVRLGLVTNGERWMLVDAPRGETTGFASWYANLWLDEQITLRAFRSLLRVQRFFAAAEADTLEAMLAESAQNQQEVTEQLGYQVRRAVEVLIQSLDRADQDHGRDLLADLPETVLYEAALTVMMRLVFLFCAEERGLLLLGDPLFDQHYAVSTLREQLRDGADQSGEEVLERRLDAWCRLLATFRAVFGGLEHDRMRLPAYSGELFDPDRFPFLEGRAAHTSWRTADANPLPVNNRTVLHLLESLQILEVKVPGGGPAEARRLSFRALDIEQIGHVYEGLLDHTAKRAPEPILGLAGTRDKEPEIPLSELEQKRELGDDQLVAFLVEQTGRSANALRNALTPNLEAPDAGRLLGVCGNDPDVCQRALPFAGLIRNDSFGYPVVIRRGSVYVTAGTDRRSSGTHYTPRSLTEPIVQYTLEPLVYVGPAEGKPKEEWQLRPPGELLDLRVCDMACGSGAFLVQACRYLSERLVEAWEDAENLHPATPGITPEGQESSGGSSERLIPRDPDERMAFARRLVAQRCLYGVDINPLAVEMAKLSLWLLTLAKDKPFTFLDHALRCGDSLVGIRDLKQLECFNLDGQGDQNRVILQSLPDHLRKAVELRRKIEERPAETAEDVEVQEHLMREAEEQIDRLKWAADMLISAEFQGTSAREREAALTEASVQVAQWFESNDIDFLQQKARAALDGRRTFHWPLEFPEIVVDRGGFDAFVCNPPFMGGKRICWYLGDGYEAYLKRRRPASRGAADLCTYFFLRAEDTLRPSGTIGYLATNTIAQGDTREIGLDHLIDVGVRITHAQRAVTWPGNAGVTIVLLVLYRGEWLGERRLDGQLVGSISAHLEVGELSGKPCQLLGIPTPKASYGTSLLGIGFTLPREVAAEWVAADPSYTDVLYPYLNGSELNSMWDSSPPRWVINFHDWPEQEAEKYPLAMARVRELVRPQRERLQRQIHEQCYWKHWDKRDDLYSAIDGLEDVLVVPLVTKYPNFVFVPTGWVYSQKLGVLPTDRRDVFAVYQSSFHEAWARHNSSTLRTWLSYSFSEALRTFPVPPATLAGGDVKLVKTGASYHQHRQLCMGARCEGLTKTYNRLHNPKEAAEDIHRLRELHVEMDHAVAAAYGWTDMELGHGFHETRQGVRYTISDPARREVLSRLLQLNHDRYAEELAQGLHDKQKPKGKGAGRKPKSQPGGGLFGEDDGA